MKIFLITLMLIISACSSPVCISPNAKSTVAKSKSEIVINRKTIRLVAIGLITAFVIYRTLTYDITEPMD